MSNLFEIKVSADIDIYTRKSFEISDYIVSLLKEKDWTQKDLADKIGKKESEISKWLSGTHNFTLKTLSKIEASLGKTIITTNSVYSDIYNSEKDEYLLIQETSNKNLPKEIELKIEVLEEFDAVCYG